MGNPISALTPRSTRGAGSAKMAGPGRAGHRVLRRDPRQHDRVCRRLRRSRRSSGSRSERPVGAQRLPADLRWAPALRRSRGRPAGPAAHLHDRHRPVHGSPRSCAGWHGRRRPARGPCPPGRRCGDHGAHRAVARAGHVRRRPGPQQGAGHLGRHRRSRRNRRASCSADPITARSVGSGSSSSTCRSGSRCSCCAGSCCARAATRACRAPSTWPAR